MVLKCPDCKSKDVRKRGFRYNNSGKKQKYQCFDCKTWFVEDDGFKRMRNKKEVIVRAVHMHVDGFSLFKTQYHLWQHDGVKIKANASSKLTKDEDGLLKLLDDVDKEINSILEEAEKVDKNEDEKYGKENRGNELPKKLQSKLSRKKAIEKAYEKLVIQKEEMRKNIEEQLESEPTGTEQKKIDKMKINVTDNDANFMKERSGVIRPNYNCQISVDEKEQFIIANSVTTDCTDVHQLMPMLKKTKENINENPKSAKADNGYYPQLEIASKNYPEIDLYIDDRNRRKEKLDLKEIREEYSKVQYKNLKKLLSKKGRKEYGKRMHTAEPPIGNLKHNLGYRYFLLRGLEKAQGEFNLMCMAHNIKKIHSSIAKNKSPPLAVALQNTGNMRGFGMNRWINSEKKSRICPI